MTRPAINPANLRRNQTSYKIRRWWFERITGALVITVLFVLIATIDSLI